MQAEQGFGAWWRAHPTVVDGIGSGLLLLVLLPATLAATPDLSTFHSATTTLATIGLIVPLTWRRSRPTASVVAVYSVALLHMLAGLPLLFPADLTVLVALHSVTVYGPRWAHRTAVGAAMVGAMVLGVMIAVGLGEPFGAAGVAAGSTSAVVVAALALASWALGLMRRARRVAYEALRDRADRLERERDQQAQLATAAERARIAREMHDIVAHSLSVVVAQADGGRYAATSDPAAAQRALETIAETGRAALADMRRLLGVLRDGGGGAGRKPAGDPGEGAGLMPAGTTSAGWAGDALGSRGGTSAGAGVAAGTGARFDAGSTSGEGSGAGGRPTTDGVMVGIGDRAGMVELAPQPHVAQIDALVDQVRAAGVHVSVVRLGTPRTLPPGVGLNVYRICQEALTNVLKHAGPGPSVTLVERWADAALEVEVTDDGRGAAAESDGGGHGLVGMRERATLLGGTLRAGPRPGGGFQVRLEVPLPGGAADGGRGVAEVAG